MKLSARFLPLAAALAAATFSGGSMAGESCGVSKMVGGRLVSETVPCAQLETAMPCYEDKRDANGRLIGSEMRPCRAGEQKAVQQLERDRDAAMKQACGRDFGKIRVGMKLARFEECTEALDFVTDTTAKGGVVETWRSTLYLVHARNGVIVGFTRRTH